MQDQQQQQFEIIDIQGHPVHGDFQVEVPLGYGDTEVKSYVDGLDLDLLLGIEQDETGVGETQVEKIKEWENSVGAGKRDDKWFSHASLEGGTDTIAYGHKLTQEEYESGLVKIGDEEVDWRQGLTEEQAVSLLNQDAGWAKKVAMASLRKANLHDDENKVDALTSLIYNVGSGSWGKSKAKKYLEAGHIEDFMHEAFDGEDGFVRISGDVSKGLQRRRAAEAQLFAGSNIEEEQTAEAAEPDPMQGIMDRAVSALEMLNPVSSAQASDVVPEGTGFTQDQGELGGLNVPTKPKVPGDDVTAPLPLRMLAVSNLPNAEALTYNSKDFDDGMQRVIKGVYQKAKSLGINQTPYEFYPPLKNGLSVKALLGDATVWDEKKKDYKRNKDGSVYYDPKLRKELAEERSKFYEEGFTGYLQMAQDMKTDPVLRAAGSIGRFSIQSIGGQDFLAERWNFNSRSSTSGDAYSSARGIMSNLPSAAVTEDQGPLVVMSFGSLSEKEIEQNYRKKGMSNQEQDDIEFLVSSP